MAEPTIPAEKSGSAKLEAGPDNDLEITARDVEKWPFLDRITEAWFLKLWGIYRDADREAGEARNSHALWVKLAAPSAMLAVCVAIGELTWEALVSLAGPESRALLSHPKILVLSGMTTLQFGAVAWWSLESSVESGGQRAAPTQQGGHSWQVKGAAASGTIAVCGLGILLASGLPAIGVTLVEAGLVALALLAFQRGERFREEWLTKRNQAERCRLVKYRVLIRPSVWESYEAARVRCETEEIQSISNADPESVERWLKDDRIPPPPGRLHPADMAQLGKLRDYYLERRLKFQKRHFKDRMEQKEAGWDRTLREIPGALFKVSFFAVMAHVVLELVWSFLGKLVAQHTHVEGLIERLLVLSVAAAAFAPTLGAGIHTWRSAWEGTRNLNRFRAKRVALEHIDEKLSKKEEIESEMKAEELLRDIWCAEQIIESEHREWLRLMKDAEWAG